MSHVLGNLSSKVCDKVLLNPVCSATEASKSLEILDIETRGSIPFRQRITKTLIRLQADLRLLLLAYGTNRFSQDKEFSKTA